MENSKEEDTGSPRHKKKKGGAKVPKETPQDSAKKQHMASQALEPPAKAPK